RIERHTREAEIEPSASEAEYAPQRERQYEEGDRVRQSTEEPELKDALAEQREHAGHEGWKEVARIPRHAGEALHTVIENVVRGESEPRLIAFQTGKMRQS